MVEKLDAMVKPWWLMPQVFVGLMVALGLGIFSYTMVSWWIHRYVFDWISKLL